MQPKGLRPLINEARSLALHLDQERWAVSDGTTIWEGDVDHLSEPEVAAWLADPSRHKAVHSAVDAARYVASRSIHLNGAIGVADAVHVLTAGLSKAEVLAAAARHYDLHLEEHSRAPLDPVTEPGQVATLVFAAAASIRQWACRAGLWEEVLIDSASATVLGRMTERGVPILQRSWEDVCEHAMLTSALSRGRLRSAIGLEDAPDGGEAVMSSPSALSAQIATVTGRRIEGLSKEHMGDLPAEVAEPLAQWRHNEVIARHATDVHNGQLRPLWSSTAASTGRVAARDPNVIALPTELAEAVGAPDVTILSLDWRMQEPWIVAAQSGSTELLRLLQTEDPYEELAQLWSVSRATAKRSFLSALYGRRSSAASKSSLLAGALDHVSRPRLVAPPDLGCGLLAEWRDVRAVAGGPRRRLVRSPDIANKKLSLANAPIQSTGAAMLRRAMVEVEGVLAGHGHIVMVVHDEIVAAIRPGAESASMAAAKAAMDAAAQATIGHTPPVRAGFGRNLAEARRRSAQPISG
jgi:mRNA-degrading endonuclease toxin of MazEF toxin-antitoxin module